MTDRPELHFDKRVLERGITSIEPRALRYALRDAIRRGNEDVAEFVMRRNDVRIYRFHVEEGIFYAVHGDDGYLRTVLTQDMLRSYKKADRQFIAGRKRKRRVLSE